jgi:hypothetical protein
MLEVTAKSNLVQDLEKLHELWNPKPSPYLNDPIGWLHNVAKQETWSGQDEIIQSVADHRHTAVKSCFGIGKSWTAAWLVGWWLAEKADPFVVTSAPTSHQVRTILWRYIRRAQTVAGLPGVINQGQVPEWKIAGELVAFGRKPADYLDADEAAAAFQGIHALNVLIILDEGSGIPEWLVNACEGLVTNENSRILVIGNPGDPVSPFARMFRPASGYNKITIAAKDTPNFTGEHISENLKQYLVSKLWVDERAKRWGKHSPLYVSKVDAEFPEVTDDTVFTPAIINKAVLIDRSKFAVNVKGRYGFDVARMGVDESCIYHNRAGYIRMVKKWGKKDTMESVGEYRRMVKDEPRLAPTAVVDVVGIGSGVFDRLKELNYSVVPFNSGEKAFNPLKYKNRRSEAYWEAKEMMDEGLIDIELEDEDLQAELLEHKYKTTSTGLIQIEPKEDIAQRLGRSPDRADAFVMSLQKSADLTQLMREQQQTKPQDPTEPPPDRGSDAPEDLVSDLFDIKM